MSKTTSFQRNEIETLYHTKRPSYQAFAIRLHALLQELSDSVGIHIDHIESRVKDLESFLEKIERKKYYDDPFSKIQDFVGLRIVTYYQGEVEQVKELICREFVVDEDHSVDKSTNLEADRFGYRSLHLIVSLSEARTKLGEWNRFEGLQAEIQVRSILQHAWAVFSREMDYKVPSQAPDKIRRRLFQLSAQLEMADEEFATLRELSSGITEEYKLDVEQGQLDLPLDLDSLREFMEQKVQPEEWAELGVQAGMEAFPLIMKKFHSAGVKILLKTLQAIKIRSIVEFERLLPELPEQRALLERFVEQVKSRGGTIHAVPVDVLVLLVSFLKADAIPTGFDWGGKYDRIFVESLWQVLKAKTAA